MIEMKANLVKDGGLFDHNEWQIILTHNGRAMTTPFFNKRRVWVAKGVWHQGRDYWMNPKYGRRIGGEVNWQLIPRLKQPEKCEERQRKFQQETIDGFKEITQAVPPLLPDVLECLKTDAQSVIDGQSFEEWCQEGGWDTDSRRAEKAYNTSKDILLGLLRLGVPLLAEAA